MQFVVWLEMQRIDTVQKTVEVPQLPSRVGFVQFLHKVVDMPVVGQIFDKAADVPVVQARRWSRRAENCGVPQLQFSDKVDMPEVPGGAAGAVPAVMDVAVVTQRQVGVLPTVEVPQIQFIARVTFLLCNRDGYAAFSSGGNGGDEGFFSAFSDNFSRSSRSSGVERQFSEPSTTESSLPSRGPHANWSVAGEWTCTPCSVNVLQKQPQPQPPLPGSAAIAVL